MSSPDIVGSRVLIGSYDQYLYSFDTATGELDWKFETLGPVHCTPGVAGGVTYVSGCDGFIRAIDVESGTEVASIDIGTNVGASPALFKNLLFAGNFDYTVMAIDREKMEFVWEYDPEPKDFPFFSSAAVAGDRIVVGGRDKMVHCIDIETGEGIWTYATGARVDSSPVIVGSRVFIGSGDGNLYEFDLQTGEVNWRFETGASIAASPAVVQGRLIIGSSDGVLYCFGEKSAPGQ